MKKRNLIFLIFIAVFILLLLIISSSVVYAQLADSPWPMTYHDPQHTSASQYAGPETNETKWIYTLPSRVSFRGKLIIDSDGTIYAGGFEGDKWSSSIYAFNPNGTLKWNTTIAKDPNVNLISHAISSDKTIYVSQQVGCESPPPSILYALDSNGTMKWFFNQTSYLKNKCFYNETHEHYESLYFQDLNIGEDGSIYFTLRKSSMTFLMPNFTNVFQNMTYYLFSLYSNGTLKWMHAFPEKIHTSLFAIGHDGNIYFTPSNITYNRDFLLIFSPNGSIIKQTNPYPNFFSSELSIGKDGIIYIGGLTLSALLPNGTILWEKSSASYFRPPIITNDSIVVMSSNEWIQKYDFNGNLKWSFNFDVDSVPEASPVADSKGNIYFSGEDTSKKIFNTYALNPNGSLKWVYNRYFRDLAIGADNTLYAIDYENLYAFGPNAGPPNPSCSDGIKNQDETDIDCGGLICGKCNNGKKCLNKADCLGNYCNPKKICSIPLCNDSWKNGNETGIDCGGSCSACVLLPSCSNGIQDEYEEGVDCGGICSKKCEYKLKLLFIPISWHGSYEDFENSANKIGNFFVNITPLKNCQQDGKVIVSKKENYGILWNGWNCRTNAGGITGGATRSVFYTAECAREYRKKTNENYDYVVGLADYDICSSIYGCSISGLSNPAVKTVISEAYMPPIFSFLDYTTTSHELGHKFGLKDQYCDCSSSWYPLVRNNCGPNVSPNPLKAELGCDASGDCCWNEGSGPYLGCRWCNGNFAMDSAKRTIMSMDSESSGFSIDEFNYLKGKGLNCPALNVKPMGGGIPEDGENIANNVLEIMIDITNNDSVINASINVTSGNALSAQPLGNYSLLVLDNNNSILYNSSFELDFFVSGIPEALNETIIYDKIPYDTSMHNIKLYHNNSLIFHQEINFCNSNGRCDSNESYLSCLDDCESWTNDGTCNNDYDGVCDKDCLPGYDVDCKIINISITNCQELQNIKDDLNANYILMNDIDCSETKNWNNGSGFEPLGIFEMFTGRLDGKGYSIKNLYIKSKYNFAGLFAFSSGEIKNLGIDNIILVNNGSNLVIPSGIALSFESINTGTLTIGSGAAVTISSSGLTVPQTLTGGFVGLNYGKIDSVYSSGFIYGNYSGGISGINFGNITNSYSNATVAGFKNNGGLSGINNGTIDSCYYSGYVLGENYFGGISGVNYGTIKDSFASTSSDFSIPNGVNIITPKIITGNVNVNGSLTTDSIVADTLTIGAGSSVTIKPYSPNDTLPEVLGFGITGRNYNTIINSYWNNFTGLSGCYEGGNSGCTAIQNNQTYFYNKNNIPLNSWDFLNIWNENINDYPSLKILNIAAAGSSLLVLEQTSTSTEEKPTETIVSILKQNLSKIREKPAVNKVTGNRKIVEKSEKIKKEIVKIIKPKITAKK